MHVDLQAPVLPAGDAGGPALHRHACSTAPRPSGARKPPGAIEAERQMLRDLVPLDNAELLSGC